LAAHAFDADRWLAQRLATPLPALGDARLIDLLSTAEGLTAVSDALARIQSAAYG
jgi:uncharacterized protein (DUF2384 family)